MSLRFVIGRSGTGKTTLFLDEIKEKLMKQPDGHPVLYIVPEQMTFLSEYRLVNTPGISGMIRTQVFSFTRLAWRILQETGGASRNHISSVGLNMLIRKIIEDHKDDLKLFKKAADKKGFIEHIERLLTEFKHYCITREDLINTQKELSFKASTRALADKLHDLELIYQKYEETLIGKYIDSNDYLNLLADSIKNSSYLKDAEIYIDGFHNFTPQEKRVIEQLMIHCKRVSMALVLNRPYKNGAKPDDLNLFRLTGETYSDLFEMARNGDILIEDDVFLAETPRFKDEGLQYLQERFDKRPIKTFNHNPAIEIRAAANRRAEVESIAREIRRLIREEGYRYNDIAILLRNGHEYHEIMETIFHDYEIPFFLDQKRSMLNHPLIEFVRSVLDIVHSNWRYEPIFRAIKTDLLFPFGADIKRLREQMDRLENYVLAQGIKGDKWLDKKPWRYKRFFGLDHGDSPQTDAEKQMEAELNESRNLVVLPILRLSRKIKKAKNVRELCEAVYLALEDLDIPNKLMEKSKIAEEKGQLVMSREHDQAWDAVVEILDQFVEVLGEQPISIETFIDILDSGLEAAKFSLIPPAIDQVFVADLELSRLSNIKASFVVGLNDGVLPAKQLDDGALSDGDRSELYATGLELAPGGKKKLLDEDFVAYRAFTIQEERLYLSYPLADNEGKGLLPSPYFKRIREIFPEIKVLSDSNEPSELLIKDQLAYVSHPNTAIAYLTSQLQLKKRGYPIADFWWDVYNFYLEQSNHVLKAKKILSSLFYNNDTKTLSQNTSKELYGEEMLASVSRMELFQGCPFSHFTSHGLRLREREIYRLDAPHIGDLFHAALKWISDEVIRKGLTWSSLTKEHCEWLAKMAVEQFAPKLQNQILLSSNRYFYIKRKLEQIIGRASYVLSSHAKVSGFMPVGLELDFGPYKQLPPLAFTLKNGTKMQLQGRIDRVDKAEDENGVYLRVIDYKSSSRALDLNEVYHGLALQMLTYLDIIITHSSKLVGTEASPAGVLYFHVHNPMINNDKLITLEDIENEILKEFKMKGLLLGDSSIIRLMDNSLEAGASNIISASINKDGSLSANSQKSSASEEDFKAIRRYVRNLYQEAGNRIISGDVHIDPYKLGDRTPCQFCSYKSICQFDQSLESNGYRIIPQQDSLDVLARIRGEVVTFEDSHTN
ncbi:helicase-exonuclease AddAB subunit AddB [Lederbergia wuyishanensis]|uniref:ATP-dependent helicase/deoxyribonuclease subunit B n=1 Tax=Lederbergia wuyishanensis TaxID=1347903 RepID=A0ABU0CYX0_9BACI|nr:helicase-exonuclease AddAB subunit AddB [Lederbergia wuyishanensis]MCJ8005969.1 helicase-exonuclease AddAB subunit AddB [Lederbergia wuyishanensis]MDQ0341334.1 ATP-dependent helicase/nuclease subunit B [Lederbergia wuyishanensis]